MVLVFYYSPEFVSGNYLLTALPGCSSGLAYISAKTREGEGGEGGGAYVIPMTVIGSIIPSWYEVFHGPRLGSTVFGGSL